MRVPIINKLLSCAAPVVPAFTPCEAIWNFGTFYEYLSDEQASTIQTLSSEIFPNDIDIFHGGPPTFFLPPTVSGKTSLELKVVCRDGEDLKWFQDVQKIPAS